MSIMIILTEKNDFLNKCWNMNCTSRPSKATAGKKMFLLLYNKKGDTLHLLELQAAKPSVKGMLNLKYTSMIVSL